MKGQFPRKWLWVVLSSAAAVPLLFALNAPLTPRRAHAVGTKSPNAQLLKVLVETQEDSPLRISTMVDNTTDPSSPNVSYLLTNTSPKPIRAYAIAHSVAFERAKEKGVTLSNKVSPDSVLPPRKSEQASLDGATYSKAIESITLIVDFVEFADGTTWGEDEFKSAEKLAGQRSGASAVAEHYLNLLRDEGVFAVLNAAAAKGPDLRMPEGHSPEWQEGFRLGVKTISARIRHANNKGGVAEVEPTLRRPFDAAGRR